MNLNMNLNLSMDSPLGEWGSGLHGHSIGVVDSFNQGLCFKYGVKTLKMGLDPNTITDTVHRFLKFLTSGKIGIIGVMVTQRVRRTHRLLRKVKDTLMEKHLIRTSQINAVVEYWEDHERRERAALNEASLSSSKQKLCQKIVRGLAWYQLPRDLKRDIIRKLYFKTKQEFDEGFITWYRQLAELKNRRDKAHRVCSRLLTIGHQLQTSHELQAADSLFLIANAEVMEKEQCQPLFQFCADQFTIHEIHEFAESTCSVETPPSRDFGARYGNADTGQSQEPGDERVGTASVKSALNQGSWGLSSPRNRHRAAVARSQSPGSRRHHLSVVTSKCHSPSDGLNTHFSLIRDHPRARSADFNDFVEQGLSPDESGGATRRTSPSGLTFFRSPSRLPPKSPRQSEALPISPHLIPMLCGSTAPRLSEPCVVVEPEPLVTGPGSPGSPQRRNTTNMSLKARTILMVPGTATNRHPNRCRSSSPGPLGTGPGPASPMGRRTGSPPKRATSPPKYVEPLSGRNSPEAPAKLNGIADPMTPLSPNPNVPRATSPPKSPYRVEPLPGVRNCSIPDLSKRPERKWARSRWCSEGFNVDEVLEDKSIIVQLTSQMPAPSTPSAKELLCHSGGAMMSASTGSLASVPGTGPCVASNKALRQAVAAKNSCVG